MYNGNKTDKASMRVCQVFDARLIVVGLLGTQVYFLCHLQCTMFTCTQEIKCNLHNLIRTLL